MSILVYTSLSKYGVNRVEIKFDPGIRGLQTIGWFPS